MGLAEAACITYPQDLIDELALKVHPFVMGTGIPLFSPSTRPMRLRPLDQKPYTSGVVLQRFAIER